MQSPAVVLGQKKHVLHETRQVQLVVPSGMGVSSTRFAQMRMRPVVVVGAVVVVRQTRSEVGVGGTESPGQTVRLAQARSEVAVGSRSWYCEAGLQAVRFWQRRSDTRVGGDVSKVVFGGQRVTRAQRRLLVAVGGACSYSPGKLHLRSVSQSRSEVRVGARTSNSDGEQTSTLLQIRSDVAVGARVSKLMPAWQGEIARHCVSVVAVPAACWYEPAAHVACSWHWRSEVTVAGTDSNCEALHGVARRHCRSVVAVAAAIW